MDATLVFSGATMLLLVLFVLGVPIYAGFLVCNILGLYVLVGNAGFGMFVNSMVDTSTSLTLVTVPLFILMGEILYRGSAVDKLAGAVDILIGGIRGRLYWLTVVISTVLAALSGSAMASAAMLGRTVVPQMLERHYDRRMTLGAAMAGACLAPIIPPSVLAIILGTVAHVSISRLFLLGVVPGLLLAVMFFVYIFIRVRLNPGLAPAENVEQRHDRRQLISAVLQLVPFTLVIVCVLCGMLTGTTTPSESAAVGVVGAIIVAYGSGKLSFDLFKGAAKAAALATGMIAIIIISSQLFSQLIAFSGVSSSIQSLLTSSAIRGWMLAALLLFIQFALCTVLDEIAVMLILVPIYIPLLHLTGMDPIWFWTIFLVNISLGGIAPPVGYVLFVFQGVVKSTSITELYQASLPYVVIYLAAMAVLVGWGVWVGP